MVLFVAMRLPSSDIRTSNEALKEDWNSMISKHAQLVITTCLKEGMKRLMANPRVNLRTNLYS